MPKFTAEDFTEVLTAKRVRIGRDSKRRWMDNVFVEWLWRSVKYEEVYLNAYESPRDAARALSNYFAFYNAHRPHQSLENQTPEKVYFETRALTLAA